MHTNSIYLCLYGVCGGVMICARGSNLYTYHAALVLIHVEHITV